MKIGTVLFVMLMLSISIVSKGYADQKAIDKPITLEEKLFRAISRSDVLAVKRLLDCKPDLLVQDPLFKAPALILAAKEKNPELVSLILKAGSPIGVTDGNGQTALDQAEEDKGGKIKVSGLHILQNLERTLIKQIAHTGTTGRR
jgi:hypothetical protein